MGKLIIFLSAILLSIGLGCQQSNLDVPKKFFDRNKIGYSPDYGLMKYGDDHVASIHWFLDDHDVCEDFAETLNELAGMKQYTCEPLNH